MKYLYRNSIFEVLLLDKEFNMASSMQEEKNEKRDQLSKDIP